MKSVYAPLLYALLLSTAISDVATAATVTWGDASGDHSWANAANWSGGTGVPTSLDDVRINANATVVLNSNAGIVRVFNTTNNSFVTLNGNAALSVSNGLRLGNGGVGLSRFVVNGPNASLTSTNTAWIGNTSNTQLDITNGGSVVIATTSESSIAYTNTSSAVVNIDGAGSNLTRRNGVIYIGNSGHAELHITNGGKLINETHNITLGYNSGGSSLVTVDGLNSAVSAQGTLIVGQASNAEMYVRNRATVSTVGNLSVGSGAGKGFLRAEGVGTELNIGSVITVRNGELEILDGAVLKNNTLQDVNIGNVQGFKGSILVDGAGSLLRGMRRIYVGGNGEGDLIIRNGANAIFDNFIQIGQNATSEGKVTVTGAGSLLQSTGAYVYVGNSGKATLDVLNGGSVKAASTVNIGDNTGSQGTVNVDGANSSLTTNTSTITIGRLGSGELNITNGGSVRAGETIATRPATGLGSSVGSRGVVNVRNQNSELITGSLSLGTLGEAELNITDGGYVEAIRDISIASSSDAATSTVSRAFVNVQGPSSTLVAGTLINIAGSGVATVNVSDGGTIKTTANNITLGNFLGGQAFVYVDGANSEMNSGAAFDVSNRGYSELYVTNGGTVRSNNFLRMGVTNTSEALTFVSGQNSKIVSGGYAVVGNQGKATLNVMDGGLFSSVGTFQIGNLVDVNGIRGTGIINVDGANSEVYGDTLMSIGVSGDGTINITNGGLVRNNANNITLGFNANSTGLVNVDGNNSRFSAKYDLLVGNHGKGTLNVSNGGQVNVETNDLLIAMETTGDGAVNVDGANSSVMVSSQIYVGNMGHGELHITNGGSVRNGLLFPTSNIMIGSWINSSGVVTVDGNNSELVSSSQILLGLRGQGILNVLNGGRVAATGSLVIAQNAGSQATVNIGAAEGDAAGVAGVLDVGDVTFGAGTGEMIFNHTDNSYVFDKEIIGNGVLKFVSGTTILTGNSNNFTGTISVADSIVRINGTLGNAGVNTDILSGSTLNGTGTLGNVHFYNGSILAPGNSIGTLTVASVVFDPGMLYEVELNSLTQSDLLHATGTVTINGGDVKVIPYPDYAFGTAYTIILADGGVTGTFDNLLTDASVKGVLSYQSNTVLLTLTPNSTELLSRAQTRNQQAVARMAELNPTNPAASAIYLMTDLDQLHQAMDLLSGEVHASVSSVQMQEVSRLRDVALAPKNAVEQGRGRVWGYFFGTQDRMKSDGNAAATSSQNHGAMIGIEADINASSYLGMAWGHSTGKVDVNARMSEAETGSHHLMGYGGTMLGQSGFALRGGASWTFHDVESERLITFAGFDDQSKASYSGYSGQIFAEISHPLKVQNAVLRPYVEGAYIRHHTNSFSEDGDAGLHSDGTTATIGTTTVGLDAEGSVPIYTDKALILNGGMGWQHSIGDTSVSQGLMFNGVPDARYNVYTTPLARDAMVLNAGIGIQSGAANFSVNYDGSLAEKQRNHAMTFKANVKF